MQRTGFLPLALLCLAVVLPGCDITINSGSGETDTAGEDTDAPPDTSDDDTGAANDTDEPDGATTSGAAASSSGDDSTGDGTTTGAAESSTGDDPTGDDPTGDDPTGDDPTGEDPTGDDPQACEDQDCEACIECSVEPGESCNAVSETCADDPDCYAFAECYSECAALPSQADYEACWFEQCVANWPDAEQPFSNYLNCLLDECDAQCG